MAKRVEELRAYQAAQKLCEGVYRVSLSNQFKRHRALADQLQRASVSVVSNISEGFHCRTKAQMLNFLSIAIGSAGEVRTQLFIAQALGLLLDAEFKDHSSQAEATLRLTRALAAGIRKSGPWKLDPSTP